MLNEAKVIGHLGKDPESRFLPSGEAVCNFTVATSETWKDKQTGEKKESTEWHRISVFGKLAEICGQYLVKGSCVYVSGKLTTRKWEKDGIERYTTEIVCRDMKMLGGRGDTNASPKPAATPKPAQQRSGGASFDDLEDDIPF